MAFVNERLTPEQRAEFVKRGIKKPASHNIANPLFRTIDEETNACLWYLGNLGKDDFHDHGFLFEYNGESHLIIMNYYFDPDPDVDRIVWVVSSYEKNFTGIEAFASLFKSALEIYAIDGSPRQRGTTLVDVMFVGGSE